MNYIYDGEELSSYQPRKFQEHVENVERNLASSDLEECRNISGNHERMPSLTQGIDADTLLGSIEDWKDKRPEDKDSLLDKSRQVGGATRDLGMEALAFYKSARFKDATPFPGCWGIFYIELAMDYLAAIIAESGSVSSESRVLAHKFIHAHEFFHFKTDVTFSLLEAAQGIPLYRPLRRRFSSYGYLCAEEGLANRAAWMAVRRVPKHAKSLFEEFMDCQPGEYSLFRDRHEDIQQRLAEQVVDANPRGPNFPSNYWKNIARIFSVAPAPFANNAACPEYLIGAPKQAAAFAQFDLPKVSVVHDSDVVLRHLKKNSELKKRWERQKEKLIEDSGLNGLAFKPWVPGKKGEWSIKVDDTRRAHLIAPGAAGGAWLTIKIGGHKEMGHG